MPHEDVRTRELVVDPARPLAAGRYARTDVDPAITFEIAAEDGDRWLAVQSAPGFFDIERDVLTPDVIAVQFAWPTAIRGARGEPASATRPDEAIDALRANPGLSIVETSEAVMAGLAGSGLTLDHAVRSDDFSPVFDVAAGPISMGPGRRLWIGFFDVGTVLLAVLVGGSIARWAEAMTAAQPILASVTVGSDGGVP